MIFLPPSNQRQTDTAIFACLGAAVLFYLAGYFGAPLRWLWQLAAMLALVVMILFVTRYKFTQHKYVLEDGDLIVVKIQGKKEQKVCHLSLTYLRAFLTEEEYQAKKKTCQCYNYLQNLSPASRTILHFEDGADSILLLLETNDSFLQALKDCADPA